MVTDETVENVDLNLSDTDLIQLSEDKVLALSLEEMYAIKGYYKDEKIITDRKEVGMSETPTDVELEVFAQTWSEHCKHKEFNAEIVGADSVQIYKKLSIGTAKPNDEERSQAVHHLVDFLDPSEEFDAGAYVPLADQAIEDIYSRQRIPIVVGGTGLYVRALLHGLFRAKPANEKTLSELTELVEEKGADHVFDLLQKADPEAAERIHPHDSFRVIRALEVFMNTGQKISDRQQAHNFQENRYDYLMIGLRMNREKLYQRIELRVDMMIEQGLLDEVLMLVKNGYSLDLKAMQVIGYKQMGMYIQKQVDWSEAVRLLKRDTRRYAKRQMTWFRNQEDAVWFETSQYHRARKCIKEFLT